MKSLFKIKYWVIAVVSSVILLGGCMLIEEIIHPTDAKVNEEIEITVKIKIVPETDYKARLVFAMLAPKAWNVASTAQLTLTTTGYSFGGNNVQDEVLTKVDDTETEYSTAKKWSAAFQTKFGMQENFGPMEWIVYKSSTTFVTDDPSKGGDAEVIGTVKIKFQTGPQAIKCNMAYSFCGDTKGFDGERYKENVASKVLEVTGGDMPMLDYTTVNLVTTVPATFGYGDIFSVVFEEWVGDTETALKGADKVYLYGKVIYDGGKEKVIDEISAKTLMSKITDKSWQKYMYPKDFFELPADAVIEKTYFHFTNADKSIVVQKEEGEDFLITESPE